MRKIPEHSKTKSFVEASKIWHVYTVFFFLKMIKRRLQNEIHRRRQALSGRGDNKLRAHVFLVGNDAQRRNRKKDAADVNGIRLKACGVKSTERRTYQRMKNNGKLTTSSLGV